jgi:hypothetical protein
MAEFLIRVQDKINTSSIYFDVKCLKRGDVVCVCPDGWPWSQLELTLPFWRIVKVPGMALDEAQAFLVPEPGDPLLKKTLMARQFKLDIDNLVLPQSIKDWIADATRAQPFLVVALAQTRALKVLKPPVLDPAIIG